jgi:hypothetical protein
MLGGQHERRPRHQCADRTPVSEVALCDSDDPSVEYSLGNAASPSRGARSVQAARAARVSPTVFRVGPFRFFFFSREEPRLHIHVQSAEGEAKFWIEPEIELARNHELSPQDLSRVLQLIVDHEQEIRDAWRSHFGS